MILKRLWIALAGQPYQAGVRVLTSTRVEKIAREPVNRWRIGSEVFDRIMLATGSSSTAWNGCGSWVIPLYRRFLPCLPSIQKTPDCAIWRGCLFRWPL